MDVGMSLRDRRSTVDLYQSSGIKHVVEVVRRSRLRWFGHVERKDKEEWVSACRYLCVDGTRPRVVRRSGKSALRMT